MVVVFVLEGDVSAHGVDDGTPIPDDEAEEGLMPEFVDLGGTPESISGWKIYSRQQNDVSRLSPWSKVRRVGGGEIKRSNSFILLSSLLH